MAVFRYEKKWMALTVVSEKRDEEGEQKRHRPRSYHSYWRNLQHSRPISALARWNVYQYRPQTDAETAAYPSDAAHKCAA